MSTELQELHDRIEHELEELERTVELAHSAWDGARHFPDQQEHFLNSLALNLHGFYNGLERIFEAISRTIDSTFPTGERWHHDLLEQMGREIPNVRPAVLSHESVEKLDEFLAFRHLVRNLYTFNLKPDRLHELLRRLPGTWQVVRSDIDAFRSLLRQAASDYDQ